MRPLNKPCSIECTWENTANWTEVVSDHDYLTEGEGWNPSAWFSLPLLCHPGGVHSWNILRNRVIKSPAKSQNFQSVLPENPSMKRHFTLSLFWIQLRKEGWFLRFQKGHSLNLPRRVAPCFSMYSSAEPAMAFFLAALLTGLSGPPSNGRNKHLRRSGNLVLSWKSNWAPNRTNNVQENLQ